MSCTVAAVTSFEMWVSKHVMDRWILSERSILPRSGLRVRATAYTAAHLSTGHSSKLHFHSVVQIKSPFEDSVIELPYTAISRTHMRSLYSLPSSVNVSTVSLSSVPGILATRQDESKTRQLGSFTRRNTNHHPTRLESIEEDVNEDMYDDSGYDEHTSMKVVPPKSLLEDELPALTMIRTFVPPTETEWGRFDELPDYSDEEQEEQEEQEEEEEEEDQEREGKDEEEEDDEYDDFTSQAFSGWRRLAGQLSSLSLQRPDGKPKWAPPPRGPRVVWAQEEVRRSRGYCASSTSPTGS